MLAAPASLACKRNALLRTQANRAAETAGTPCAMVYGLSRALLGEPQLSCHRPPGSSPGVDPSIGGSGPRAFAVRDAGARLAPSPASTASHRNVRDVRTPLLSGGTGELVVLICPTAEAKSCPSGYFVASPRDEAIRRPRPSTSVAVQESPLRNKCSRCNGRAPRRSIWRRLAAFTSLIQVTPRDS
jgi:hypothetical protein